MTWPAFYSKRLTAVSYLVIVDFDRLDSSHREWFRLIKSVISPNKIREGWVSALKTHVCMVYSPLPVSPVYRSFRGHSNSLPPVFNQGETYK